ncbi:MAG: acetyl-CoA carboxylase biotin carboxylase subunit, partial [Coriobacteriia bacterium]|nr:acetyl-CoA carboxylase biotin carboxylase subunit [Coriobacteriia bacterium]
MLKRILVANRGEIAARVIRACREMNIETVAVCSEADEGSLFSTIANLSVCIGGPASKDSYLNQDALLAAAAEFECDGVHPGYGFLSENAEFAARVREAGLAFIGPSAKTIAEMGDKRCARELMREHGVPIVPGSDGLVADIADALATAERIGYPVLLKASAGGGGRGMRRVDSADEMESAYSAAKNEALACFGVGDLYLEKLILNPRHIEVQIVADSQGTTV